MKKRKSTRETKNMIQTALWLPRDLHYKLKEEGGERGLSVEIRRRLEASFEAEKELGDPKTRELLRVISVLPNAMVALRDWPTDRWAFEVLKHAINVVLAHFQPPGDVDVMKYKSGAANGLFHFPDDSPETVGRILAGFVLSHPGGPFGYKWKG
jgi:hypothetical protein